MGKDIDNKTIQYLQMLQGSISRMSTASAIFKGFSATIVSGIALISLKDISIWILALSFLPVVIFWALDIYYLRLERVNRYWYEQVRLGKKPVDFRLNIKPTDDNIDSKEAEIRILCDCILSKSIWMFYPFMVLILVITLVMKCKGVI